MQALIEVPHTAARVPGHCRCRPLGVSGSLALNDDQFSRLKALEEYDLSFLEARLRRKKLVPDELVEQALLEFRRFIALLIVTGRGAVMYSEEVDEVWHNLILFTREYAAFCEAVHGRFIHHQPWSGRDVETSPGFSFVSFQAQYLEVFDDVPRLWKGLAEAAICQCDVVCDMPA